MDTLAQRGRIVVAALVLLAVGATALPWQSPQTAEAQATDREVTLEAGWNLVGWTGSTAIDEATASIADALLAAFTWDGEGQSFRSFNPSGPTFLNTLSDLALGDGVWINVSEASTWLQPAFGAVRTVSLSAGFTLATWTGPDAMPVEDAVAEIAGNLESLFTWDAVAQTFLSFTPSAPSFLNSAKTLGFGDGVWLRMSHATEWSQPASGAAPAPVFAVTSSAFAEGEVIPRRYTCDAQNVSPPLTLSGVPADAVNLALILDDPDAPGGTWVHWVEFNRVQHRSCQRDPGGRRRVGHGGAEQLRDHDLRGTVSAVGDTPLLLQGVRARCDPQSCGGRVEGAAPGRDGGTRHRAGGADGSLQPVSRQAASSRSRCGCRSTWL